MVKINNMRSSWIFFACFLLSSTLSFNLCSCKSNVKNEDNEINYASLIFGEDYEKAVEEFNIRDSVINYGKDSDDEKYWADGVKWGKLRDDIKMMNEIGSKYGKRFKDLSDDKKSIVAAAATELRNAQKKVYHVDEIIMELSNRRLMAISSIENDYKKGSKKYEERMKELNEEYNPPILNMKRRKEALERQLDECAKKLDNTL
ncbi:MAG: hypothetical protein HDR94_07910 [Bacteroides sp.]|nr:hypothetical protein [Bacteroides sp.]